MQALAAALSDDTRRSIVELLAEEGDQPAGEIASRFAISRPAVSRHLRVLRDAGLVHAQPRGTQRVYSLNPEPLAEVDAWLERYRRFWAQRLDALDTEISRGKRERR